VITISIWPQNFCLDLASCWCEGCSHKYYVPPFILTAISYSFWGQKRGDQVRVDSRNHESIWVSWLTCLVVFFFQSNQNWISFQSKSDKLIVNKIFMERKNEHLIMTTTMNTISSLCLMHDISFRGMIFFMLQLVISNETFGFI
jgi:hypothetical protein